MEETTDNNNMEETTDNNNMEETTDNNKHSISTPTFIGPVDPNVVIDFNTKSMGELDFPVNTRHEFSISEELPFTDKVDIFAKNRLQLKSVLHFIARTDMLHSVDNLLDFAFAFTLQKSPPDSEKEDSISENSETDDDENPEKAEKEDSISENSETDDENSQNSETDDENSSKKEEGKQPTTTKNAEEVSFLEYWLLTGNADPEVQAKVSKLVFSVGDKIFKYVKHIAEGSPLKKDVS
jgi:hypothetical protein